VTASMTDMGLGRSQTRYRVIVTAASIKGVAHQPVSFWLSSSTCSRREPLGDNLHRLFYGLDVLRVNDPNKRAKKLNETLSPVSGLASLFLHPPTGLPTEGVMLTLHQLYDTNTIKPLIKVMLSEAKCSSPRPKVWPTG